MASVAAGVAAFGARRVPPQGDGVGKDEQANLLPHEYRWNEYFAQRGFVRAPHTLFSRLPIGLSGIELSIVGLVLQRTVGAPTSRNKNRPEYAAVTIPELAKLADCSENGAANAVGRLVKWGVLASRAVAGNKRANEYAVRIEAWDSLDVKAMRKERATLKPDAAAEDNSTDEESDEQTPAAERSYGTARRCKPGATATITITEPTRKIRVENSTGLAVSLAVAEDADGVTVRVAAAEQTEGEASVKDSPSRVGESGRKQGERIVNDSPSPVGESKVAKAANTALTPGAEEFAAELDRGFAAKIGAPVPRPLVAAQFARLGAAGVALDAFWARCRKRAAAFTEWGFLVSLVDDVVAVAAIERSKVRAMPKPQPEPDPERPDPLAAVRGTTYKGGW